MKKQKTRLQTNNEAKPDGAYGKTYVIIPAGDFIAEPIAGFNRKHAYCRPCKHVGPMMAVAPHAVNRSGGGHSVAGHAYPWAYTAELLVQDGGAEKANDVCPEGNEWLSVPSGRVDFTVYFSP